MLQSFNLPIWLYPAPVDFRKQMDGLVTLVADHLSMNPASGQMFVFRNRHQNKIKILWWDRNGFWLCYRRLEQGRFTFPPVRDQVIDLTRDQLNWLLSGLDCLKYPVFPEMDPSNFY